MLELPLSAARRGLERVLAIGCHADVRHGQVPVKLRDLVLEDQLVSEGVPEAFRCRKLRLVPA
jgi:hypothetical protein